MYDGSVETDMSITEHLSDDRPGRSIGRRDRDDENKKKAPEDSEERKENAATYKENVDQVNRAREKDMERALSAGRR
jgi:hypothetical protein